MNGSPVVQRDVATAARVHGIAKVFPGTRALDAVDLDVRVGEIHALVGGNGSGKSTLIKILAGIQRGEPGGRVEIGASVSDAGAVTPEFARAAGVRVVHQDLGVFLDMSVAENLALGHGYATTMGVRVRWSEQRRRARRLIEQFEIDARPGDLLRGLSQSTRTLVAIARACQDAGDGSGGLLILDEPTASLPEHEVGLLLGKLRGYAAAGLAILYVSHRLDEILRVTDRTTVLRDGVAVGTYETADLDEDRLIELIVGAPIAQALPSMPEVAPADPLVSVRDLAVGPLRGASLDVAPGEVIGIAGLLGSGRSSLLRALFGLDTPTAGTIALDGVPARFASVAEAMAAGVAYVPENRLLDAAFPDQSVAVNLAAGRTRDYRRGVRLRHARVQADAEELVRRFGIKTSSVHASIATLSGGNQQKVVLARWLAREPRLLLLDEPTQGVDVGARADIWRIVRDAAAGGMAVIVVTSDLEELAQVVDRALILREGRIVAEATAEQLDAPTLTRMAYFETGR